jgi:PAS domain S-box-containing protein
MHFRPNTYGTDDARRFELLVRGVTDYAIYMLDLDGYITSWNTGAERIKGYTDAEILGEHFSLFFTPEDQQRDFPKYILAQARKNGRFESEGWRVRKNGARFWANAVIDAIYDENKKLIGFAKITRDLTERKVSQEALLQSENRFRMLIDAVIDYAIYMLDPSGIITNWNTGAERMKGYRAEEIIGHHFSRFYTKEDRAAGVPARVLETARREGRYESEGWRVRSDGSRFWANVIIDAIRDNKGQLIGFAKITRDMTERQAAQETLRESERQFRLLVSGVTDYALFMLDPQGIVTNWNQGAERIKGYSAEEIVGQHFSRFYTEADRRNGMPGRALNIARSEGRFEAEGWRVRKDGTMFWANVIVDPIRDEDGQLIGFAKITRDITERRNAELALQKAQAERDHAQRLEALGKLTGGVAHDFNNLLMIVSGHLETLKRLQNENPKARRALDAIEQAANRAESLTRQLLTFSRRQTLNPETFTISERLESLRTLIESSVGSSVRLVTQVPDDVWPVLVDPNELELALVNVVINARDAMPKGGVITLTAGNVVLPDGEPTGNLRGDYVTISLTDTGTGIAPDIVGKIFDPFFTTKEQGKGTGLGLSQVHGFAHQSGGTIRVSSKLGNGTTVTIYLPHCAESKAAVAEEPDFVSRHSGTALIVEDNPDVASATATLVEQLGYTTIIAENASVGLERLARGGISLVITDIVMAGEMDGIALAHHVRKTQPRIPIVMVTGYAEQLSTAENDFTVLRKPYRMAELNRAISKATVEAEGAPAGNVVRLPRARRAEGSAEA